MASDPSKLGPGATAEGEALLKTDINEYCWGKLYPAYLKGLVIGGAPGLAIAAFLPVMKKMTMSVRSMVALSPMVAGAWVLGENTVIDCRHDLEKAKRIYLRNKAKAEKAAAQQQSTQ